MMVADTEKIDLTVTFNEMIEICRQNGWKIEIIDRSGNKAVSRTDKLQARICYAAKLSRHVYERSTCQEAVI